MNSVCSDITAKKVKIYFTIVNFKYLKDIMNIEKKLKTKSEKMLTGQILPIHLGGDPFGNYCLCACNRMVYIVFLYNVSSFTSGKSIAFTVCFASRFRIIPEIL